MNVDFESNNSGGAGRQQFFDCGRHSDRHEHHVSSTWYTPLKNKRKREKTTEDQHEKNCIDGKMNQALKLSFMYLPFRQPQRRF